MPRVPRVGNTSRKAKWIWEISRICSPRLAPAGAVGEARGGEGFKARGGDRLFTLTVDFVEAATGGKQRVSLAPEQWLDVTIPPGHHRRPGASAPGQGRARLWRRPGRRRADRGACGAAPAVPSRRRQYPDRAAGQPRRGGARGQGDGADGHRAGDDDDPQGFGHRRAAAPARQGNPAQARVRATNM